MKKIFIAGHRGMVGSAILRRLQAQGENNFVLRTHRELDLIDQAAVKIFFEGEKPNQVYLAAAKVGGIHANNIFPAEFIYNNLMIESNIIDAAYRTDVEKLVFLGSSCIYPKLAEQPMQESALLTDVLEPTNEPYAIAKIAGIKLCESYNRQYGTDFRSVMPTNLYGPGDNYHPENSHVIPALIHRFHCAKMNQDSSVAVWGETDTRREFLYVDDMALASIHVMNLDIESYSQHTHPRVSHLNVGVGDDITIKGLAILIAKTLDYHGEIEFDTSRPKGTARKLLDSSKMRSLGWQPTVGLEQGLALAYSDYIDRLK